MLKRMKKSRYAMATGELDIGDIILLKDRVYNTIKTQIILGRYKPGDKLNIVDIAAQMSISCAPVREALSMLSKDGLVKLPPHKKPVVTEPNVDDWGVSMEIRKMLEPYVARLSAKNVPQADIDEVRAKQMYVIKHPDDLMAYVDSDMALHQLLNQYSGSKLLSDILDIVKAYTLRIRYFIERSLEESPEEQREVRLASTREHIAILDAVEKRDPGLAYNAVLAHIDNCVERDEEYHCF
jgi:DNA-binding GntR family transcriptional regulator